MKTIENIINEGKIKNIMVPEYDVKPFVDIMLDKWLQSVNSYSFSTLCDSYNKIALCRQCEIVIYLLNKFSDDITLHFVSADTKVDDKQKLYYGYNLADRLLCVFNVIMKVMEVDDMHGNNDGLKDGESIADEVSHLKKEFTALVDKYNKKYNEKIETSKAKGSNTKYNTLGLGNAVACDCECECGCATC